MHPPSLRVHRQEPQRVPRPPRLVSYARKTQSVTNFYLEALLVSTTPIFLVHSTIKLGKRLSRL